MLRPVLLVGVGGSGGKTLRAVRQALDLRLQQAGWKEEWPAAWQFLHVDSPVTQDGVEFPAPFLPTEDYVNLVATGTSYTVAYGAAIKNVKDKFLTETEASLPSKFEVTVPVELGAGKYRGVGRTLIVAKMADVKLAASTAIGRLTSDGALSQLAAINSLLGNKAGQTSKDPIVIVVSSIAGGSGAGQYVEVTEAIKNAAPTAQWVHSIFSLLYAPDVFKSVGDPDLIAPNSLGAMAEAMSGMWSTDLEDSTKDLYQAKGINIPGIGEDPKIHIGPRFNFVIGRENNTIDFKDQPDVYKAVAASLSTWITDDRVQDKLMAYNVANFSAGVGAMVLPDATGIKDEDQAPPFASMGFGRVSLGRDKFLQYAGERIARSSIDQMLYAHSVGADHDKFHIDEIIDAKAKQNFPDFLSDIHLSHNSDETNEILIAVRPAREAILGRFYSEIFSEAQEGVSARTGGQSVNAWGEAITAKYQVKSAQNPKSSLIREEEIARSAKMKEFVATQKQNILAETSRAISQLGIKVAVEMLKMLEEDLTTHRGELSKKRNQYQGWANSHAGSIATALQAVQGQESVRVDNPAVSSAIEIARNCFYYLLEAELLATTESLLEDMVANFIRPLREHLFSSESALLKVIEVSSSDSSKQNLYETWPKMDQDTVPLKFKAAPNEFLLIETSTYPEEFDTLIAQSVAFKSRDYAFRVVIDEVLMGKLALDDLEPESAWQLIDTAKEWIPLDRAARIDESQSNQPARFEFSAYPQDYLTRAMAWMQRKGSQFYRYLHEDIAGFLDEKMEDRALLIERQQIFKRQFKDSLLASEPLVKLNSALLMQVHNRQLGQVDSVMSTVPFDKGSQAYAITEGVLNDQKMWNGAASEGLFNSAAKGIQNIDVFSVQSPFQPVVMNSIVQPISEAWLKHRADLETRRDFMKWRRARPLFEAVPASPAKKRAMLRGWYVARILGQLDNESNEQDLGPHLKIWNPRESSYDSFPYPLMHGDVVEADNYPGAILQSLSIALVMCNSEGSLAPLDAYKRLMYLGDIKSGQNSELLRWIIDGKLSGGTPKTPNEERAGSAGTSKESLDERREKVLAHIEELSNELRDEVENLDHKRDSRNTTVTWEIKHELRSALSEILEAATKAVAKKSGI
jgi:uncharacterized FlaG/YvyC family protein